MKMKKKNSNPVNINYQYKKEDLSYVKNEQTKVFENRIWC